MQPAPLHRGRVKTLHEAITRHCRRAGEMEALVITCALGQNIPVPTFTSGDGGAAVVGYDAVLTDVPCSGDGTLRKDPDVLRRWHPGGGNCLHATQLAVARRAAQLVRPGGLLLYSTCSLNPIEDEAVVAGILTGPGGDEWELEAGAVERGAPGMKHRAGVSHWGVAEHVLKGSRGGVNATAPAALYDSDGGSDSESDDREVSLRWYGSYDEAAGAGMPAAARTMWPPAPGAEARKLHLERCARFLPHDQDTGGFFVALLRRREAAVTATDDGAGGNKTKKKKEKQAEMDEKVKAAAAARAMVGLCFWILDFVFDFRADP
jgi:tRNA (cytosine34-C5)-methyltransferase